jgi:hypothetical protein
VAWKVDRTDGDVTLTEACAVTVPHDGKEPGVIDMALHLGGRRAVALNRAGELYAVELRNGARPRRLGVSATPEFRSLHLDPRAGRFTFVNKDGKLATCAWDGGAVGPARGTEQSAASLAMGPTGRWAAAAVPGRGVAVYDLENERGWLSLPPENSDVWGLAWSPDGTRLAVGLSDGDVAIWKLEQVRAELAKLGLKVASTARPLP